MYGAILGDMIGSPYEFKRKTVRKDFPLFNKYSRFTDDTVMTIAVAEALMDTRGKIDDDVKKAIIKTMQKWGRKYPRAGYGGMFYEWLFSEDPRPYGSYGNGSAMRVSSAGWLFDTIEETRKYAGLTAEVTHNHPEGIKGAQAVASAIYLARKRFTKEEIRDYMIREFDYDLSHTCDDIRRHASHGVSCQETVPEAITAFLEGAGFEHVIRLAVSLGGDCDTIACMAGSIAEAFYGVPDNLMIACEERLEEDMLAVLKRFVKEKSAGNVHDATLDKNGLIERAIDAFYHQTNEEHLISVLTAIRTVMHTEGHFLFPVFEDEKTQSFAFRTINTKDQQVYLAAFTSYAQFAKGEKTQVLSEFIDKTLKACLDFDVDGMIINPWGQSFVLKKDLIAMIFKADGQDVYLPDQPLTEELLEGGEYLKKAIEICRKNRTKHNVKMLLKILSKSNIWIPCNAVFSEQDYQSISQMVEGENPGDLNSLVGKTFKTKDTVRMVPDILQNGEHFFFPVFSSAEEMGEYGSRFSKVEKHFLEAVRLARNNERDLAGIVINAFSNSYVIDRALFEIIETLALSEENQGIVS
ncbi:MAG: ADP-ribosylglycohydrolase family protein [bacterium]